VAGLFLTLWPLCIRYYAVFQADSTGYRFAFLLCTLLVIIAIAMACALTIIIANDFHEQPDYRTFESSFFCLPYRRNDYN